MSRVCVVGLGRVGLPTATAFARAGYDVVGVDTDPEALEAIRFREIPWVEPDFPVAELGDLALHGSLGFDGSNVVAWIIAVGTNDDGLCSGATVLDVARGISAVASESALVVVESTVPPGTCEKVAKIVEPRLVAHCPERAAPGAVMDEIATLPRLVGGVTAAAANRAAELYRPLGAPLVSCSARESELSKLIENAARAVGVAFANEVAKLALEAEIDPFRLRELANSHPRVDLLRPGLGAGGQCLPMALGWVASRAPEGIAAAARNTQALVPARLIARLRELDPDAHRIALLGTAYKPGVRYAQALEDPHSPAHALAVNLTAAGYDVRRWDPSIEGSPERETETCDAVIFGCAHPEFEDLSPPPGHGRLVLDPVGAVDLRPWSLAGWCTAR